MELMYMYELIWRLKASSAAVFFSAGEFEDLTQCSFYACGDDDCLILADDVTGRCDCGEGRFGLYCESVALETFSEFLNRSTFRSKCLCIPNLSIFSA